MFPDQQHGRVRGRCAAFGCPAGHRLRKYTLIIGQHLLGDPGYSFEKQAVDTDTESGKMTLNLVYSRMGGASPTVITTFYVWGLYSKLPGSAIDVKITII